MRSEKSLVKFSPNQTRLIVVDIKYLQSIFVKSFILSHLLFIFLLFSVSITDDSHIEHRSQL